MAFLDDNYLLSNPAAKRIFQAVRDLPILDAHNHADVQSLAENRNFTDIWQLFGASDHYVWSLMRRAGVPEEFITGARTPKEKFRMLGKIMPLLAGNPVYEWLHLDLRRMFQIDTLISEESADEIFDSAQRILAQDDMKPLAILKKLNVQTMCSTDDPCDTLEYHKKVNAFWGRTLVRPTWRPDAVMKIENPAWKNYVQRLNKRFDVSVKSLDDLSLTLRKSHDFFAENHCCASDVGVEIIPGADFDKTMAEKTFRKALAGETLSPEEVDNFRKYVLALTGELDSEKDWAFQLHFGAVRNVRPSIYSMLGPDSGIDVGNGFQNHFPGMIDFLNYFDNRLKVVLYCFDPGQIATVASVARAFSHKVKIGAPWWQCDNPIGMKRQLEYFGSVDLLSNCAGMVSDSRKLLSYGSRHEMFRRVLSDVLGNMAELGQAPEEVLLALAIHICYEMPRRFFGF